MKRILLALAAIVICHVGISQNLTVEAGSPLYDSLKQAGTLNMYEITYPMPVNVSGEEPLYSGVVKVGGGGVNLTCGDLVDANTLPNEGVGHIDDSPSSSLIPIPFTFCFYGQTQTGFYVNCNGNISFGAPYATFTADPFPNANFSMIAPFWGDVDNRPSQGLIRYEVFSTYAVVRWQDVGYYNQQTDKINNFQVVISDGVDPVIPGGNNVAFSYADMQWTTGSASGGVNGFGGSPATVGANLGDGVNYVQFGLFDQAGGSYDGGGGNNDGIDWLDSRVLIFNVCPSGGGSNIPPTFDSQSLACDTIEVCYTDQPDTFVIDVSFINVDPGTPQTVTTTIDTSNGDGFVITSNTVGSTSDILGYFISSPNNAGYNTMVLSATDDGTPPQTTEVTLTFHVSQIDEPVVNGEFAYCPPGSTDITLTNSGDFDSYTWSNGTTNPNDTVSLTEGDYYVTAYNSFGCAIQHDFSVVALDNLILTEDIANVQCFNSGNAYITYEPNANVSLYYAWVDSNGDTIQSGVHLSGVDSLTNLVPGEYSVFINDLQSCFSYADTIVITQPEILLSVINTQSETCEEANGMATVQVNGGTTPYAYNWEPVVSTQPFINDVAGGTYILTTTDANGCVKVDTVEVPFVSSPVANYDEDADTVLAEVVITFMDLSSEENDTIVDWFWDFGDGNVSSEQNPTHAYADTGLYPVMLIVTNTDGCTDTIVSDIYVSPEIEIPNVFTPNGDNINETFEIKYIEILYPGSTLKIYNRWGKKVYESDNYKNEWDGEKHKAGTYFYELLLSDGTALSGNILMIK